MYGTGVTGAHSAALPGSPTNAGYTEAGLHQPAAHDRRADRRDLPPGHDHLRQRHRRPASFRFAYSRANGDIADAAAAAKGKKLALVFVNDARRVDDHPEPVRLVAGDHLGAGVAVARPTPS